jgi:hypothetical protein
LYYLHITAQVLEQKNRGFYKDVIESIQHRDGLFAKGRNVALNAKNTWAPLMEPNLVEILCFGFITHKLRAA